MSTPVPMHGGLLCIAFCLSVCLCGVTWPKICHLTKTYTTTVCLVSLDQNFVTWPKPILIWQFYHHSMMTLANCNSWVKSISFVTGRCALFNVKLHFYISIGAFSIASVDPPFKESTDPGLRVSKGQNLSLWKIFSFGFCMFHSRKIKGKIKTDRRIQKCPRDYDLVSNWWCFTLR